VSVPMVDVMSATVIDMPPKVETKLKAMICVRITKEDRKALDRLTEALPLKLNAIARVALRIGVEALERDPTMLLSSPLRQPPRSSAKRR
jgi:hypothetical protein